MVIYDIKNYMTNQNCLQIRNTSDEYKCTRFTDKDTERIVQSWYAV